MKHLADRNYPLSPLNRPPRIVDRLFGDLAHDPGRRKVAIYAAGHGRDEAPLDDPSWAVWTCNLIPPLDSKGRLRVDLWFDLHQKCAQTDDDLRWIASCPVPIVVPDDLLDIGDHAVALPSGVFDIAEQPPFACTFAYQIAMALLAGYQTIGLYGVELAWGDERERTVEWASVNWWVGFAEAKGVKIERPHDSRLGRHPHLYGLDYEAEKKRTAAYIDLMRDTTETGIDRDSLATDRSAVLEGSLK